MMLYDASAQIKYIEFLKQIPTRQPSSLSFNGGEESLESLQRSIRKEMIAGRFANAQKIASKVACTFARAT